MQAVTIDQLVAARIAAKAQEDAAVAARRELDQQIAALLSDANKPEGTVSQKLADGKKVSVTYAINRKVDTESLQNDWARLSDAVQGLFRWKAEISVTELRKLDDKAALVASKYYESKPGSPSVKIEL
jgi:hypothetical protein